MHRLLVGMGDGGFGAIVPALWRVLIRKGYTRLDSSGKEEWVDGAESVKVVFRYPALNSSLAFGFGQTQAGAGFDYYNYFGLNG